MSDIIYKKVELTDADVIGEAKTTLTDLIHEANRKPCPFCGSTDISVFYYDPYDGYQGDLGVYKVRCRQCGVTLQNKDITKAMDAWNTRAEVSECPQS